MKTKSIFALLFVLMLVTACSQATPTAVVNPPTQPGPATPTTQGYPPPVSLEPTPTIGPYPGPTSEPTQSGAALAEQAAIQEVSKKYSIPVDQIKILSTEPMTWNNGCMGVVLPGVLCTDVIVNGYIVKLEGNGQQFEIHSNQDGTSVIDAAEQLATLNFVILNSGQALQVVTPSIGLGPTYNPAFTGFLPMGSSISGTAYVLVLSSNTVVAVDANGQHNLSFIQSPSTGLAVWRGGLGTQPLLAWGTQPIGSDHSSSLIIAGPDGSNQTTLFTTGAQSASAVQLVAEFWSADGTALYFSKEPVGLGGYILFAGASNLYKVDISTKTVTEVIPPVSPGEVAICLDAISGDYRYVADHCTTGAITVRDLQSSGTTTIQMPADFTSYGAMGTARFSPSGDRVAFALAKHNPDDEQGWVAIGSSSGGTAKIILTSDPGNYYYVIGWLDDQTLLVQSYTLGSPNGVNQVLTVSSDGSLVTKVAEGNFLTVIDNR
ncbi:MAG TPA: hypothetical protein VLD65_01975 [Anaerolineales bacterium]|nr:hypothetical protein [Anaerolineales bacterium]